MEYKWQWENEKKGVYCQTTQYHIQSKHIRDLILVETETEMERERYVFTLKANINIIIFIKMMIGGKYEG